MHQMNTTKPDLNLLMVFDAIATAGSVTHAADRLCLSQPAVSHALNRLRDVIGDPLFVRSGNGLVPTRHAEAMIDEARELLDRASHLLASPHFDPATATATFRVGASDYALMTILPDIIRTIRREAPGLQLEIRHMGGNTRAQFEVGELDLAFWGASPPDAPLCAQELFREHFVGLICARHPLAIKAGQGALTLDDYLAFPHVMVSFRDPRQSPIDTQLSELGRQRTVAVVTPNFSSNVTAIVDTDLIMSLPAKLAPKANHPDFVRFDLPMDIADYPYSIIWHHRNDRDPAVSWLRSTIAEQTKAL